VQRLPYGAHGHSRYSAATRTSPGKSRSSTPRARRTTDAATRARGSRRRSWIWTPALPRWRGSAAQSACRKSPGGAG
jgi:hypothetical protein